MMARKTRKSIRRRRSRKDGLNIANMIKIGILLIFFPGVIYLFISQKNAVGNINPATLCDLNKSYPVIAILIDASDEIEIVKRTNIRNDLVTYARTIPKGARTDIYVATGIEASLPAPVFSKCNPGEPGKYDGLTRDEVAIRKRFEEEFLGELKKALSSELDGQASKRSPIIESIRAVAAQSFTGRFDKKQSQLLIVSDMLQNSVLHSHYKNSTDFKTFKNSSQWANALARLDGINVHLFYVMRDGSSSQLQNLIHIAWWEQYFRANSAIISRVDRY